MKRYANISFNDLKGDYIQPCIKELQKVALNPTGYEKNIAIMGEVGTGKTAIAYSFLNALTAQEGFSLGATCKTVFDSSHNPICSIYTVKNIIDDIKSNFNNNKNNSTQDDCKKVPLLIIDEIGLQYGTKMERIELFDIIDYRYNEMLPTIIISNLYKPELIKEVGQRIYDRLLSNCECFEFRVKSKRR